MQSILFTRHLKLITHQSILFPRVFNFNHLASPDFDLIMLQGFYCWGVHQCFRVFADFIMKSTIGFAIFWHKQAHLGMRGTPSKKKETGELQFHRVLIVLRQ